MLTTSVLGWQTDMLAGRLAVHLPSASEGIAACAIELEMSGKCDKGIQLYCSSHVLRYKGGGGLHMCMKTHYLCESGSVCVCRSLAVH